MYEFIPTNYKELYNLRHTELRNIVERIIGIFKKCFRIIREDSYYPMVMQARLVHALCTLHNFIRVHDPSDDMEISQEEIDLMLAEERSTREGVLQDGISDEETQSASQR